MINAYQNIKINNISEDDYSLYGTTMQKVNTRRLAVKLAQQVKNTISNFIGYTNSNKTVDQMKQLVENQVQQYVSNGAVNNAKVIFDQEKNDNTYNLARNCFSYEEFCMKKSIEDPTSSIISEQDWQTMHDSNPGDMAIQVQFQPTKAVEYINVDFNIKLS